MKYRTRRYFTESDKALMWDRWQKGESLHSIASHFGCSHGSIAGILARTGGIRPLHQRRVFAASDCMRFLFFVLFSGK